MTRRVSRRVARVPDSLDVETVGRASVAAPRRAVIGWSERPRRVARRPRTTSHSSREDDRVRRHTRDTVGIRDHLEGPARNALPRPRGHVVVGAAPHHRRRDLLLPPRARARHRAHPGLPRGVRRRHRHLQEPDHGPRRGRARRGDRVPRATTGCASSSSTSGRRAPRYQRQLFWVVIGLWVVIDARLRPAPPHERLRQSEGVTDDRDHRRRRASPPTSARAGLNLEKWGWIYMRVSGVAARRADLRPPVRQPLDRRGHPRASTSRSSPASSPPRSGSGGTS